VSICGGERNTHALFFHCSRSLVGVAQLTFSASSPCVVCVHPPPTALRGGGGIRSVAAGAPGGGGRRRGTGTQLPALLPTALLHTVSALLFSALTNLSARRGRCVLPGPHIVFPICRKLNLTLYRISHLAGVTVTAKALPLNATSNSATRHHANCNDDVALSAQVLAIPSALPELKGLLQAPTKWGGLVRPSTHCLSHCLLCPSLRMCRLVRECLMCAEAIRRCASRISRRQLPTAIVSAPLV
jgi:hypothetical protein